MYGRTARRSLDGGKGVFVQLERIFGVVSESIFVEGQRFRAIVARNGGRVGSEAKRRLTITRVGGPRATRACRAKSLCTIKQNYATTIVPVGIGVVVIQKLRVPWNRY